MATHWEPQSLTAVKRGNFRQPTTMDWSTPGSRTRNQHEGVLAHFRRHPAAWVCGNPFGSDRPGQKYRCAFGVSYFDLEGRMCSFWVHPSGRISDFAIDAASETSAADALETAKQYGLFRGD